MKNMKVRAKHGVGAIQDWFTRTDPMGSLIALVLLVFEEVVQDAAAPLRRT